MNTLEVNFPVAPDFVMPQGTQQFFLVLTAVLSTVLLAVAIQMAIRDRSLVPLLIVLSGALTTLLEPVVTFLGHAVHSTIGASHMFTSVDRLMPWHVGFGYTVLFGGAYLFLYNRARTVGLTAGFIWRLSFLNMLVYIVMETLGVTQGLWHYYDRQALYLLTFTSPPFWWVLNVASEMAGAAMFVVLVPLLRGWRQIVLPFLGPMGAFAGHMGAGYLWYNAVNSAAPAWLIEIAGIISIMLGLFVIWLSALAMTAGAKSLKEADCAR